MATTLDDVINSLPPERREKIEHLTAELVEEVATLPFVNYFCFAR